MTSRNRQALSEKKTPLILKGARLALAEKVIEAFEPDPDTRMARVTAVKGKKRTSALDRLKADRRERRARLAVDAASQRQRHAAHVAAGGDPRKAPTPDTEREEKAKALRVQQAKARAGLGESNAASQAARKALIDKKIAKIRAEKEAAGEKRGKVAIDAPEAPKPPSTEGGDKASRRGTAAGPGGHSRAGTLGHSEGGKFTKKGEPAPNPQAVTPGASQGAAGERRAGDDSARTSGGASAASIRRAANIKKAMRKGALTDKQRATAHKQASKTIAAKAKASDIAQTRMMSDDDINKKAPGDYEEGEQK